MTAFVIARTTELDSQGNPWATFQAPSVARVGSSFDVVFGGSVGGPGYQGVFVDRAVTTSILPPATLITTQQTITVPGLGSNLDIRFASQGTQPSISSGGHTAFDINVIPVLNKQVVLTKGPSSSDLLRIVCYEGQPVSGTTSDTILVAASPRAIATNGDVGFRASTSSATPNSSGVFRWEAQTSALQLVAHTDQLAVGTSDLFSLLANTTNQPYVAEFGSSAHGAFRATVKPPGGSGISGIGVWIDDPNSGVTHVHDTTDFALGVFNPPTPFVDFHAPAVNSLGRVAFRACLAAGCVDDGVWTGLPGGVALVARKLDSAPNGSGGDSGDDFVTFSDPAVNESGAIAFRAETTGMHPEGIWRRASQFGVGLRRVVRHGDLLRGTSLQFVAFGEDVAVSDSGELAFTATMSDNKNGLFTTATFGATPLVVKIVKEGEAFPFSPTQDKVVTDILFHSGAYAMGSTGFIQTASVPAQPQGIGFALTFADASRALVLSTVE